MGASVGSDVGEVVRMQERKQETQAKDLGRRIERAYGEAYPELDPAEARHRARNLTQVLAGVIDLSERLGQPGEITQVELAETLVYWCISNTYLEDLREGKRDPLICDPSSPGITQAEIDLLVRQLAATAADMLLAIDVLREDERLLAAFVKGTVAMEGHGLEADRSGGAKR